VPNSQLPCYYLESKNLISPTQAGFRPVRSTNDQVFLLSQSFWDDFQTKRPPDRTVLATIDFSKAFDLVWHAALIHKLLAFRSYALLCLLDPILSVRQKGKGPLPWRSKPLVSNQMRSPSPPPPLTFNPTPKFLSVTFVRTLSFGTHVQSLRTKFFPRFKSLRSIAFASWCPSKESLSQLYKAFIQPVLSYAPQGWYSFTPSSVIHRKKN